MKDRVASARTRFVIPRPAATSVLSGPLYRRAHFALPAPGFSISALALCAGVALFMGEQSAWAAANTSDTVNSGASLALDNAASYNFGLPGATSDVIFSPLNTYSGTYTINTNPLPIGTLDDFSATAIAITGSQALTLNLGTNAASEPATLNTIATFNRTNPADLLYVAPGGTLTYSGTGGIVLGAAGGNVDIASSDFGGTGVNGVATINSVISDGGSGFGFSKTGVGTLILTGANTYSGATNVVQGNLTLNFAATGAPTSNIVSASSALTLGGYNTSGGGSLYAPTEAGELPTLLATGKSNTATSQTFNGLTVNPGSDELIAQGNGTGSMTLALGAITVNSGGSINFNRNGTGSTGVGVFTTSNTTDASGLISGVGGAGVISSAAAANSTSFVVPTDYATVSGGTIVPYTGYTALAAGAITSNTLANYQVTATSATALTAPAGTTDLNTIAIKSTSTALTTLTIATGGTVRFGANGGILGAAASAAANNAAGLTITGGSITAGGSAIANNPGTINFELVNGPQTISSNIVNNGTGAVTLAVNAYAANGGTNPNTALTLSGTNTFSGGLFINSGRVAASSTAVGSGTITIGPAGQLNSTGGTFTNALVLEGSGGGNGNQLFDTPGELRGGTFSGLVTLAGDAGVAGGVTFSGQVTGPGGLLIGRPQNSGASGGNFTLSSNLDNYQGNTEISEGILTLGASNVIPSANTQASDTGNVILTTLPNNGSPVLNLNGKSDAINGLVGFVAAGTTAGVQSGIIANSSNGSTSTLTLGYNNATATYTGAIADNIATSGTGKVAITKTGSGTETFSGASTFSGGLTVNGGTLFSSGAAGTPATGLIGTTTSNNATVTTASTAGLAIGQGVSGTNIPVGSVITAITGTTTFTISSNATAAASGTALTFTKNFDSLGIGAVTVNNSGTLDLGNVSHSIGGAFSLSTGTVQDGSLAVAGASTLSGTNTLGFNVGTTTASQLSLAGTVTASGTDTVALNLTGRPASTTSYTLINAPAGNLTGATFALAGTTTGTSSFGLSFTLATTSTALTLTESVAPAPGVAYFVGSQGKSFSSNNGTNSNFSSDSAGTMLETQLPGAATNVHFYATNANTANVAATTLDGAFAINSLTVDGSTLSESSPVGIASGTGGAASTLTINATNANGNTAGNGILVNSGAGAVTISAPVVAGASQTWTNNSANTLTLSGGVSDNGTPVTITLGGSGITTLAGGGTSVNGTAINLTAGTLNLNNALGTLAAFNVGDGTTLAIGANQTVGALNNTGTTNNSGSVTLASATTLTLGSTNNLASTFTGVISGGGSLAKAGTGTATLSGANTYGGGTTVGAGTLQLSGASATLGSTSGPLTVNTGGTLDLNGVSAGVGNFTGTGGTVLNSAGSTAVTLTIGTGNGTGGSFAGVIENNAGTGGTVAVTKVGTGSLSLGGINTYSGATTVSAGTLIIGTSGSIANSAATVASASTLTLSGGTTIGAIADNGTLNIQGSTAVKTGVLSGSGATGVINYTNTLAAGNTLTFSGTNTFLGFNNANAGNTLVFTGTGSNNTFTQFPSNFVGSNTATNTFQSGTYTFVNGSSNVNNNDLGNFNVAGATVVFTGGLFYLDGGLGGTTTVSGGELQVKSAFGTNQSNYNNVAGTSINFNVTGGVFDVSGAQFSYGNAGNGNGTRTQSQADNFSISGGVAQVGLSQGTGQYNAVLGDGTANVHTVLALSGGTFLVNGTIQAGAAPAASSSINFNWTGGTLTAGTINMTNLTDSDGITTTPVAGTLYNGGGRLAPGFVGTAFTGTAFTNGTQYTGGTTITGNYQVDSPNASLAVNLGGTTPANNFGNAATNYDNVTISGTAVLGGRLNVGLVGGFATTPPTSGNTFSVLTTGNGTKTVNSLTGTFTNTETSYGGSGTVTNGLPVVVVGSSGLNSMTVTYNAGTAAVVGSVVLGNYNAGNTYVGFSGNAWDQAGAANWSVFDPGSTSAPATVASGALAQFADGTAAIGNTGSGPIAVPLNSTRNVQGVQFSSAMAGHNYTLQDGGSGTGMIVLDNTGNNAPATISDVSATGNVNTITLPITLHSSLVTTQVAGNTVNLGGVISGVTGLSVTQSGPGTLILSGANTYAGATNVTAGTMLVNGSIGSATPAGILSVTAGTLGGTGNATVSSAAIGTNGTLAPGATVNAGTGALTLNTTSGVTINGTLAIALGTTGNNGTFVNTTGGLTISGATLALSGNQAPGTYDLINYSGTNTSLLSTNEGFSNITGINGMYSYSVVEGNSFGATDIELDVTSVPEPSTWVFGALSTAAVVLQLRRRKARSN